MTFNDAGMPSGRHAALPSGLTLKYQRILRAAPFWLALLALLVLALKSSPNGQLYQGADKLYHWFGFAVLTFSAHLAFPRVKPGTLLVWTLIGAASIELLQGLSAYRTPSLGDMTVNVVGVLTGLGAMQLLQNGRQPAPHARSHSRARKKRRSRSKRPDIQGEELR